MGPAIRQQAENGILRRLFGERSGADHPRREAAMVAITSGKGGTGKSFVASNLAVALSHARHRVTLVDCDFGLGNAHLLLGLNPRITLQHVLGCQATIEEARRITPYGPALVPAGSGISRLSELSEKEMFVLTQGLARLATSQDVLLLDTAAGISPQCLLTLLLADHVVLVTNPEIAALTDAYALIKCLARQPASPPISVVVNRVPVRGFGQVTFDKLRNVAQRFAGCEINYLGEIPDDPAVTQRRLGQPPLLTSHPDCEAAMSVKEVMHRLRKSAHGLRPRVVGARRGLMQRFQSHLAVRDGA